MNKISRRVLARYAADQLLAGAAAKKLGDELVAVMSEQQMQGQIEQLMSDIHYELEHRGELAVSQATSARPLSETSVAEIEMAIKHATEVKHVSLTTRVDESLIGGVKIETATQIWDESLKHKLANLRGVA